MRSRVALPDTPWTPVVFQNGWKNVGSSNMPAQYRRKNGIVYLRGLINGGGVAVAFTLPLGFRPLLSTSGDELRFMAANDLGSGATMLSVKQNGEVSMQVSKASSGWIDLAATSWSVN